jgi:hypothetical protein
MRSRDSAPAILLEHVVQPKEKDTFSVCEAPHVRREPPPAEQGKGLAAIRPPPGDLAGLLPVGLVDVRADGAGAPLDLGEEDGVGLLVDADDVYLGLIVPPAPYPVYLQVVYSRVDSVQSEKPKVGWQLLRPTVARCPTPADPGHGTQVGWESTRGRAPSGFMPIGSHGLPSQPRRDEHGHDEPGWRGGWPFWGTTMPCC